MNELLLKKSLFVSPILLALLFALKANLAVNAMEPILEIENVEDSAKKTDIWSIVDIDNMQNDNNGSKKDLISSNIDEMEDTVPQDSTADHNDKGKFHDNANLVVLNKNLAETTMLSLSRGQSVEFDGLSITLHICWKESANIYDPENKALIEIVDKKENKTIFNKWMFSNHNNIINTFYKKYIFMLKNCE